METYFLQYTIAKHLNNHLLQINTGDMVVISSNNLMLIIKEYI